MKEQKLQKILPFVTMRPDPVYKKRNRDVLLSQISNTAVEETALTRAVFDWPLALVPGVVHSWANKPAIIVVLLVIAALSSGIFGINASQETKPGDSLYIAKIVGEKAKFALTFDDRQKAMLGIEFAGNRAQELTDLLSERSEQAPMDSSLPKQISELTDSVMKEIDAAQERIRELEEPSAASEHSSKPEDSRLDVESAVKGGEKSKQEETDGKVFVAGSEKDSGQIEIADNTGQDKGEVLENKGEAAAAEATSTVGSIGRILEQAREHMDNNDYQGAAGKLEEAKSIIETIEIKPQVKSESSVIGTSSQEKAQKTGTSSPQ